MNVFHTGSANKNSLSAVSKEPFQNNQCALLACVVLVPFTQCRKKNSINDNYILLAIYFHFERAFKLQSSTNNNRQLLIELLSEVSSVRRKLVAHGSIALQQKVIICQRNESERQIENNLLN